MFNALCDFVSLDRLAQTKLLSSQSILRLCCRLRGVEFYKDTSLFQICKKMDILSKLAIA